MLQRTLLLLLLFPFSIAVATGQDAPKKAEPEKLKLWNGKAPIGDGKFEQAETRITVYKPEKPNGTAIVICPGGGYIRLVTGVEGDGISAWLNRHGITAIVLEYRLPAGRPYVAVEAVAAGWQLQVLRTTPQAQAISPIRPELEPSLHDVAYPRWSVP